MSSSRPTRKRIKIVLDPTKLSDIQQHQIYDVLCNHFPTLMTFASGAEYSFKSVNPENEADILYFNVSFTHDIVRRPNELSTTFEVLSISKEIPEDFKSNFPFIKVQPIDGVLHAGKHSLTFLPHPDMLALDVTINPATLTDGERFFLSKTLADINEQHHIQYFPQGLKTYLLQSPDGLQALRIHLNLQYALLQYAKKNGLVGYEIIGDVLGEGGFGCVSKGMGVLVAGQDGLLTSKSSQHVIKDVCVSERAERFDINPSYEHRMARRTSHLHSKPPIRTTQLGMQYLSRIERRMPGVSLLELIEQRDVRHKIYFGIDARLDLTIALLRALKEQVHDKGIIHRDIKPENIMVDINTMIVSIVDFGLSKLKTDDVIDENVGTIEYAALETFENNKTNELTDVYSIAVTIAVLWGVRYSALTTTEACRLRASQLDFPFLFYKIDCSLDAYLMKKFRDILAKMTHPLRDSRASVNDAIQAFEKIRLQHVSKSYSSSDRFIFKFAHYKGAKARADLAVLELAHEGKVTSKSILDLQRVIEEHLRIIDDVPMAVTEFVQAVGVRAFKGSISKADISDTMADILKNYQTMTEGMDCVVDAVDDFFEGKKAGRYQSPPETEVLARKLKSDLAYLNGKSARTPLTVDAVVSLISRVRLQVENNLILTLYKLDEQTIEVKSQSSVSFAQRPSV